MRKKYDPCIPQRLLVLRRREGCDPSRFQRASQRRLGYAPKRGEFIDHRFDVAGLPLDGGRQLIECFAVLDNDTAILAADALSRQDDRRQRIFELTLLIQLRFIQLDVQLLMMTKMAEDNNGCHDGVGLNHEVSKTRSLHKVYFYREGH